MIRFASGVSASSLRVVALHFFAVNVYFSANVSNYQLPGLLIHILKKVVPH